MAALASHRRDIHLCVFCSVDLKMCPLLGLPTRSEGVLTRSREWNQVFLDQ